MSAPSMPGGDQVAGTLDIPVVGDLTGFKADLERKVEEASKGLRAQIRAELVGKRKLRDELQSIAKDQRVKVRAELDAAKLKADLADLLRDHSITVGVNADTTQADRAIDRTRRDAERDGATVRVDADAAQAVSQVEAAKRAMSRSVRIDVRVQMNSIERAGRALTGLTRAPAIASGVLVLGGALTNVAAGLTAVASSGGAALGVLGAIPTLATAGVQALGATVIGLSGIGDAVKAVSAAEEKSATVSKTAGRAREAAQKRVAEAAKAVQRAQESADRTALDGAEAVADARERVADAMERAAEQVANAEDRLAQAQERARDSQEDLTRARERARERLEDLQLQLRGIPLDEESARLALERAQIRERRSRHVDGLNTLDYRESNLALRQAQLRLDEVLESNEDLRQSGKRLLEEGVSGSEEVEEAQERIAEANKAVLRSEEELAEVRQDSARDVARAQQDLVRAVRDTTRANADAQESIVDAQTSLVEAQRDAAEAARQAAEALNATSASADKAKQAMDALSPAGQRFVTFLTDELFPAGRRLRLIAQEGLLPGLQEGIETLVDTFLPKLERGLESSATTMGRVAKTSAESVAEGPWSEHFEDIVDSNNVVIERLSAGLVSLLNAMGSLVHGAGPFSERVAAAFQRGTESIERFMATKDADGGIDRFLTEAGESAKTLWTITSDLAVALANVARAAKPTGDDILTQLAGATDRLRIWTENPENFERMERFFADSKPLMDSLGRFIIEFSKLLLALGEATNGGVLDGFFWVLNGIVGLLERLASIPGFGTALGWIFTLAGVGLGLGVAATALGRIVRSITTLARLTGLSKITSMASGLVDLSKVRSFTGVAALVGMLGKLGVGPATGAGGAGADPAKPAKDPDSRKGQLVYWTSSKPVHITKGGGKGGAGGTTAFVPGGGGGAPGPTPAPEGPKPNAGGKVGRGGLLGGLAAALGIGGLAAAGGDLSPALAVGGGALATVGGLLAGRRAVAGVRNRRAARAAAPQPARAPGGGGRGRQPGMLSRVGGGIARVGRGAGRLLGGKLGIGTIAAGLVAEPLARRIDDGRGGARSAAAGALKYGASGAGLGALAGSVVPGVGTAVGAAVGGAGGALYGALKQSNAGQDLTRWFKDQAPLVQTAAGAVGAAAGTAIAVVGRKAKPFTWVATKAADTAKAIPGALKGTGDAIGGVFRRTWDDVTIGTRVGLSNAKDRAGEIGGRLVEDFKGTGTRVVDNLRQTWRTTQDDVKTNWGEAKDRATEIGENLRANLGDKARRWTENLRGRWQEGRRDANSEMGGTERESVGIAERLRHNIGEKARSWRDNLLERWRQVRGDSNTEFGATERETGGVLDRIRGAFSRAVGNIDVSWRGVLGVVQNPVRSIVNTVYDRGIKSAWNFVAGLVGAGKLPDYTAPFATGGVFRDRPGAVHEYATGGVHRGPGVLRGYAPGRDRVNSILSPGEGVLVPEAVRGLSRVMGTTAGNAIRAINSQFSSRVKGAGLAPYRHADEGRRQFAGGGIMDWVGEKLNRVKEKVSAGFQFAKDAASNGAKAAMEQAKNPLLGLLNAAVPGGTPFRDGLRGMATKAIDSLIGFGGQKDSEAGTLGGGAFAKSSGGWPPRAGYMSGRLPLNTAAAVGFARARWGGHPNLGVIGTFGERKNESDHPYGKAIDFMIRNYRSPGGIALGNEIANWFTQNAGTFGTKYAIWRQQYNGGRGWRGMENRGGDTANHFDHPHISFYKKGGVAQMQKLREQAKLRVDALGQGRTQAVGSRVGKAFATPQMAAALAGPPDLHAVAQATRGALANAGAGGRGDVVFHEGSIQVQNPSPEPASTSVHRRLTHLQTFGMFR